MSVTVGPSKGQRYKPRGAPPRQAPAKQVARDSRTTLRRCEDVAQTTIPDLLNRSDHGFMRPWRLWCGAANRYGARHNQRSPCDRVRCGLRRGALSGAVVVRCYSGLQTPPQSGARDAVQRAACEVTSARSTCPALLPHECSPRSGSSAAQSRPRPCKRWEHGTRVWRRFRPPRCWPVPPTDRNRLRQLTLPAAIVARTRSYWRRTHRGGRCR
jgi:hypothetical protein